MMSIGEFASTIVCQPLYAYQETIANAILDSVHTQSGRTFTVMLARQMGKNQLSAMLEAYLLYTQSSGSIIKAAPTYRPQVANSYQRLLRMLESDKLAGRVWRNHGYIIGLAASKERSRLQSGPRTMFYSANPSASIVGATASLLLEIDEAQDVSSEKFNCDLRPMASTTNATTILYGTAWSDSTLLATMRAHNLELERLDGIKRHFEYDWRVLAKDNEHYRHYVESEIARLGENNVTIRTQYNLLTVSGIELLFDVMKRGQLCGHHAWEEEPRVSNLDEVYVAGMDVGGEERNSPGAPSRHDSTVITIGRVSYNELQLPVVNVVHQYWWTGKHYLEQYAQTASICERWGVRRLIIDTTGLGDVMTSLLQARLGEECVRPFRFSRPSKSRLGFHLLSMVGSDRCKLARRETVPIDLYDECWKQLSNTRRRALAANLMDMYVEAAEGHDDFLISLALCCEAVHESCPMPILESHIIRPRRIYYEDGYY